MTGTISFGGIASGLDTDGIVAGLVSANSARLSALRQRASSTRTAITHLSDIGRSLNGFHAAASAISTVRDASGYAVSSSGPEVVPSISGAAMPGSFDIEVLALAAEHRTYSRVFDSNVDALGQSGTLSLAVGTGTPIELTVDANDSLEGIAAKINASGLRLSASTFYDGAQYRLQVRGLDTGSANGLTFVENGTSLDLNGDGSDPLGGKTFQTASDATVLIDGFSVTRPTNQISGAIPGIAFAITAKTTSPVHLMVASDSTELAESVKGVVDAFNAVVKDIHRLAGFGEVKASDPVLAGDGSLRSMTSRLAFTMSNAAAVTGRFSMLAQIGVTLARDGTINFDSAKLTEAVTMDPDAVAELLASKMAEMSQVATGMQDAQSGLLALRKEAMDAEATRLDERAEREQDWLDRYAESLKARFTKMDLLVADSTAQLSQIVDFFS